MTCGETVAAGLAESPLLTDLYQLAMLQSYLEHGKTETAVFEFFVRRLPPGRSFLLAAGLEQLLDYLEGFRFSTDDIAWLRATGRFSAALLDALSALRFSGDVDAVPEGTVVFGDEPIVRVTAPLPEAQLIESRLINLLHFQTLIASKAARLVLAAPDRQLVDFGLRRAHGAEAGLLAARASYLAGFTGSATLLAEKAFGIPAYGTMAHSFIQAHDSETQAFRAFAESRPDNLVLLLDTYDTEAAARKVARLAPALRAAGASLVAVRLDSGDLIALARSVRTILDAGGLQQVAIFASGGLDETELLRLVAAGAPIDGFGIGTSLTTSSDVPALDCAYKLQEYAGRPRRKRSPGKATWPGRKQIWRLSDVDGHFDRDVLSLADDRQDGEPLLQPVMRAGHRLAAPETLAACRARAQRSLASLPEPHRRLQGNADYTVQIAPALRDLADRVDRDLALAAEAEDRAAAAGLRSSGHAGP